MKMFYEHMHFNTYDRDAIRSVAKLVVSSHFIRGGTLVRYS